MSGRMNSGERQALRQVVRQRMKVLRADVAARKAELLAEVDEQVNARFAARDKLIHDLNSRCLAIIDQAGKDIEALIEQVARDNPEAGIGQIMRIPAMVFAGVDQNDRRRLAMTLRLNIEKQVGIALVDIDRQEADLIQEITLDGLETDAAVQFLGRIPTVGQLVPASRIMEITA